MMEKKIEIPRKGSPSCALNNTKQCLNSLEVLNGVGVDGV